MAGWALIGVFQLVVRAFEHQLGQPEAEHAVGLMEHLSSGLRRLVERLAHPDVLRALPRKDESHALVRRKSRRHRRIPLSPASPMPGQRRGPIIPKFFECRRSA